MARVTRYAAVAALRAAMVALASCQPANPGDTARLCDPLTRLPPDLATPASTPNFSFISPNLCDDGHEQSFTGQAGPAAEAPGCEPGLADHLLRGLQGGRNVVHCD